MRRQSYQTSDHIGRRPTYGEEVLIVDGEFGGRIGVYDNDDYEFDSPNNDKAVVSFGNPLMTGKWHLIEHNNMRAPLVEDLLKRKNKISGIILGDTYGVSPLDPCDKCDLLLELILIDNILFERIHLGRYGERAENPVKIFLSHSSKDNWLVRQVHDDLKFLGHEPWLDELEIKPGEPLIERIEAGAEGADYLIFFVSKAAIDSGWVRAEWESQMHRELSSKNIRVIAARIDDTEMPPILKRKKYIDFRIDYIDAFQQLLEGIGHSGTLSLTRFLEKP